MLWIRVSNPKSTKKLKALALAIVDTGADDCLFPAETAIALGHNLRSVPSKSITGINSSTKAYPHTSQVEILETGANGLPTKKVLFTIKNALIDFIKGSNNRQVPFLLGTKNFLSKFVLTIDYPKNRFSIRRPSK